MKVHKASFAIILITLLFCGWWSGVDYLQRDFMPAFWFVSSLSFAFMISVLIQQLKDDS